MMMLSKNRILAGLQCEKRLYLKINRPELSRQVKSPFFESGIRVGEQARREFPGGVLVKRFQADGDAFAETVSYLKNSDVNAIFEAGFRDQEIEVFVDILQRDGDAWKLIEVKSASAVKEDYIDDATIQYRVLIAAGINISTVEIMYLDKYFIYQGDGNYDGLFIRADISEKVIAHKTFIDETITQLRQLLTDKKQPVVYVDSHCKHPYPCEFRHYCEQQEALYPVSWLPNAAVITRKLHHRGIYDIRHIPIEMLSSESHLKVRRITIEGKAELDDNAAVLLRALHYPRYYLDFESVNFAVPQWPGSSPNQQLPFQWSCHKQQQHGCISHNDFIDVSGRDARRQLAMSLIEACATTGPVIVYNQTFEKAIIKSLAREYAELRAPLLAINNRVFDLYPVMNRYYYHPDMRGSWSLKNVLSCLLPELRYSDLGAVQDGLMAQSAYHEIISGRLSAADSQTLVDDLRAYCRLDTYAMLAIVQKVCA